MWASVLHDFGFEVSIFDTFTYRTDVCAYAFAYVTVLDFSVFFYDRARELVYYLLVCFVFLICVVVVVDFYFSLFKLNAKAFEKKINTNLFFNFKVFIRWVFISIYLHICYVSLFWCYWRSNRLVNRLKQEKYFGIENKNLYIFCQRTEIGLPDRLQRIPGHVDAAMHDIWQRPHQRTQLQSMRYRQRPT